jgi:hypothetical protein
MKKYTCLAKKGRGLVQKLSSTKILGTNMFSNIHSSLSFFIARSRLDRVTPYRSKIDYTTLKKRVSNYYATTDICSTVEHSKRRW